MIADTHVHTRLSPDAPQESENTILSVLDQARKKGLQYIAETEHCDIITGKSCYNVNFSDYEASFAAAEREQIAAGRSQTRLLFGIELAHAHTHKAEAAAVLAAHSFDFVLGSLHMPRDGVDAWAAAYQNAHDDKTLLGAFEAYVGELYEIASECDFDSLGALHLSASLFRAKRTYAKRFARIRHSSCRSMPMFSASSSSAARRWRSTRPWWTNAA